MLIEIPSLDFFSTEAQIKTRDIKKNIESLQFIVNNELKTSLNPEDFEKYREIITDINNLTEEDNDQKLSYEESRDIILLILQIITTIRNLKVTNTGLSEESLKRHYNEEQYNQYVFPPQLLITQSISEYKEIINSCVSTENKKVNTEDVNKLFSNLQKLVVEYKKEFNDHKNDEKKDNKRKLLDSTKPEPEAKLPRRSLFNTFKNLDNTPTTTESVLNLDNLPEADANRSTRGKTTKSARNYKQPSPDYKPSQDF